MTRDDDPVMAKIRAKFENSGWTQQALGEAMGYPADSARKSVSQFLRGGDPRISTVQRFAKAMKMSLSALVK